jgi:uncharacterized membrane protein YdjX (TVP38/TMEM64 family)
MRKKILIKLGAFMLLFYLLSFVLTRYFNIGLDQIHEFVLSFGLLAPLVYSVILFLGLTVPLNPLSDFLVINLGVIAFSPYVAIIFTFFAHCAALTVNYFVGKKYGMRILEKIINEDNAVYLDKYMKELTIKRLFLIRFFVPIATVFGGDILSYVSGIQKLPFLKFFLVSIIPWTILNTVYFTTSSYLLNVSIFLYFIPVIFIVGIPILAIYLIRKKAN